VPFRDRLFALTMSTKMSRGDVMTVEVVLMLTGLWMLVGLIDAWVLHQLGRSGWRLVALCAVAGPLSLSILYDEVRPLDKDPTTAEAAPADAPQPPPPAESLAHVADEPPNEPAEPFDWPADDPEGPFILQGYRGLSDR